MDSYIVQPAGETSVLTKFHNGFTLLYFTQVIMYEGLGGGDGVLLRFEPRFDTQKARNEHARLVTRCFSKHQFRFGAFAASVTSGVRPAALHNHACLQMNPPSTTQESHEE
jgi:hypothetical protein